MNWLPIHTKPESGEMCLLALQNSNGDKCVIRGLWYANSGWCNDNGKPLAEKWTVIAWSLWPEPWDGFDFTDPDVDVQPTRPSLCLLEVQAVQGARVVRTDPDSERMVGRLITGQIDEGGRVGVLWPSGSKMAYRLSELALAPLDQPDTEPTLEERIDNLEQVEVRTRIGVLESARSVESELRRKIGFRVAALEDATKKDRHGHSGRIDHCFAKLDLYQMDVGKQYRKIDARIDRHEDHIRTTQAEHGRTNDRLEALEDAQAPQPIVGKHYCPDGDECDAVAAMLHRFRRNGDNMLKNQSSGEISTVLEWAARWLESTPKEGTDARS